MKFLLLFAGCFAGCLLILLLSALFGALVDNQRSTVEVDVQTPAIVIDPKIRDDLSKALAFDAVPASIEVQNPFIDRAGIGNNAKTVASPVSASPATTNSGNAVTKGEVFGKGGSAGARTTIVGSSGTVATMLDPGGATQMRYNDRLERLQRGEYVGPESEALSVDDLVPVGYAGGGNRADEVILFSSSLCRTFSFPVGTRFFDGWLNSFSQNEVVFTVQNGYRRKSYSSVGACRSSFAGSSSMSADQR